MKFLADRINQVKAQYRESIDGVCRQTSARVVPDRQEPAQVEINILRAANALVDAEAEWLLQKLLSDLLFVRAENGNMEEVERCIGHVRAFMSSRRDFESSEFWSVLQCADRILSGLDFEPSSKYTEAFRNLRCKAVAELRAIYSRHNLKFSL
ncbi:MAG TPA: hypothetical protein VMZ27_05525 [Candidatus Saccharimonadales bacterium]|nr:hypothetical protein [Candidatus Saccharimonadales bacterium]